MMAKDNAENYLNHDNYDNDQVDIDNEDNEAPDANGEDDDDCDEESVKETTPAFESTYMGREVDVVDVVDVVDEDATPAFQSTYVGGEGFAARQPVSTQGTIFRQLWIFFPSKQAEFSEKVLII